MPFFETLIIWAIFFVASQLLMPEPEIEHARPAALDDFNFPTATEGRVVPLIFGTEKLKGPNVTWYGDLTVQGVTKMVRASMFNRKRQIVGYRYFLGVQFGVGLGPLALRKIWVGDELAWSGNLTTESDITVRTKTVDGLFTWHPGTLTQTVDAYLAGFQSPTTAYRGYAYGVLQHGYVGGSENIKPWSFEVTRIPNGLALAGDGSVTTYDANPMNVMYELLTDTDWGYGYPDADIDKVQLAADGLTLFNEGNGMSLSVSKVTPAKNIRDIIEKQCDCNFRLDTTTGKFTSFLVRDGYSLGGLKQADNSTVISVEDFSRGGWEGTVNFVRIQYKRRSNDYTDGYAPAQDMANMNVQGRKVAATYNFPAVRNDALANDLAWREIRSGSYPLAKARLQVDRTFWDVFIGEVIVFNYTCDKFDANILMRVIKSSIGNQDTPEILIDVVQDVFTNEPPSFAEPVSTAWVIPDQDLDPIPALGQVAFEAPYAMSRREESVDENKIFCAGTSQGREESGILIKQRNDVTNPAAGSFYDAGIMESFMYVGTLDGAVTPDDTTIDIITTMDVSEFADVEASDVGKDLINLVMIGTEFVAPLTASTLSTGIRLNSTYRGLLDSAQRTHADSTPVYFIYSGGNMTSTVFPLGYYVDIRLLPYREGDDTAIAVGDAGVTEIELQTDYRERRPYPPTKMNLNASDYPTGTVSLDVQSGSTEDEKGIEVDYNRRDWRIYDEVSQLATDASVLDASFPSNNTTQYRLRIYNDPDGADTLIVTIAFADASSIFVSRTEILRYLVGVIPTKLRANVTCRHTDDYSVVREARYDLDYNFDTASAELAADNNWGVVSVADTYTTNWTAPDTGTYPFKLGTSGPSVWASVNGGAEQEIITAASTTGNLTGVTASDTIKVKYKGSVTGNETIVLVESPVDSEDAYVVFV